MAQRHWLVRERWPDVHGGEDGDVSRSEHRAFISCYLLPHTLQHSSIEMEAELPPFEWALPTALNGKIDRKKNAPQIAWEAHTGAKQHLHVIGGRAKASTDPHQRRPERI